MEGPLEPGRTRDRYAVTRLLREFLASEKSGGLILIACAIGSMLIANSHYGEGYAALWKHELIGMSVEHWINDGLMAVFFFLIGLELKREIYVGELSDIRIATLPISGALGGMIVPAAIYMFFNFGTLTRSGAGIPMATDIAFALGILSLLGNRVPVSLKVFLTALAVIDDLGAIIVIAVFYTTGISALYLGLAVGILGVLFALNRFRVVHAVPYLIGGGLLWLCMLHSGIHATIAGVLLAMTYPFGDGSSGSPASRMQHLLHLPVALIILPVFALANTCLRIDAGWSAALFQPLSVGVIAGLVLGKPLGIALFSYSAVKAGLCALPANVKWMQLLGIGMLGGIGFTMSIFIALLAFSDMQMIDQAKIAILVASLLSGVCGYLWLRVTAAE